MVRGFSVCRSPASRSDWLHRFSGESYGRSRSCRLSGRVVFHGSCPVEGSPQALIPVAGLSRDSMSRTHVRVSGRETCVLIARSKRDFAIVLRPEAIGTALPAVAARQPLTRDLRASLASVRLGGLTRLYRRPHSSDSSMHLRISKFLTAVVASILPAARAARVDVMQALRSD